MFLNRALQGETVKEQALIMAEYHLTKTEKTTTDPEKLDSILSKGTYTSLALCRGNEPYIVTLSYGYDRDAKALYCHCAKKGLKLDIARENNRVCGTVIVDHGYIQKECGQPFTSVVYRGTIEEVDSLQDKKYAMSVLLNHLEDNPDIIRQSKLDEDRRYNAFAILRISLEEMTAKSGR